MEPRCYIAPTERQIYGKILLFYWPWVHPLQESEGGGLLVSWMDYWLGTLGTGQGPLDQSPCKKWHFLLESQSNDYK